MKKTLMNAATVTLAVSSYESPVMTVVDVHSEGVLCSSFETYDEETLEW